MRHYVLGKHGWSAAGLCVLLPLCVGEPAHAAPNRAQGRLAIGSPLAGTLVAGRISVSVAYDTGLNKISAFTLLVDEQVHSSRDFIGVSNRGIQYLDLDTRTLPDGNHTLKIVAKGTRGIIAIDEVNITVRNGVAGGADTVPPLVQFRNLTEGSTVRGKVSIDVLAEDNTTTDLLVSIFVNQFPRLIKSRPPYNLELNTSEFLDPMTGLGKVTIEAWAYDKFNNLGKARSITLRVEPEGPSENQTKAPDGALTRPMRMDMEPLLPAPLKAPMEELVIPVRGMRGEMPPGRVDPRLPQTASASMSGRPTTSRTAVPGTRPSLPRMARATMVTVDPEFAPVGSASRGGLAGGKTAVPYLRPRSGYDAPEARPGSPGVDLAPTMSVGGAAVGGPRTVAPPRPAVSATARAAKSGTVAPAPAPVKSVDVASAATGPRVSLPATRPPAPEKQPQVKQPEVKKPAAPAPKLTSEPVLKVPLTSPRSAATRPAAPTTRADEPLTPYPGPRPATLKPAGALKQVASRNTRVQDPEIVPASDMGAPLPLESTAPRQSGDGPRAVRPPEIRPTPLPVVKPAAKKPVQVAKATPAQPASPLIVLVDPKGSQKGGTVKAEVFRLNPSRPKLPKDRSYQVRRGDSLQSIAKKHGVTAKSLLVANGLTAPRLRTGSILKVPGTFDIVMNDRQVEFDVSPRIENGIPLTPFRQIFEHAGGLVVWNPDTQEVRAANDRKDVKLRIGSKDAVVNQVIVVMDREAFLDSGRTFVPVSFMEKALDLKAEYDVKNGTIMLVRK